MEGYLLKWVNYVFGWKRRYFILHNGVLHYCQEKGTSRKGGAIHLNIASISLHPKNPRRIVIDSGCTLIHLKAATADEARTWMLELRAAKESLIEEQSRKERSADEQGQEDRVTELLAKLSSIQATLEEEIDSLQAKFRDPVFERVVQASKDIKVLPMQYTIAEALRLINEEHQRCKEAYLELDRKCVDFCKNMDLDVSEQWARNRKYATDAPDHQEAEVYHMDESEEFQDALSHMTNSDMFFDAADGNPSVLVTEGQLVLMPYRKTLPFLRNPNQKYNIWKVVKDSIGQELSKMAVPVYFNEPISFLQRFAEDMIYNDLLTKAAGTSDPLMRLALIGCFAVSGYSVTSYRVMKPFNPLLGETFELVRDGFQLISEQVSHHPPVSALHCDHSAYTFWGSTEVVTSFKGVYLLVHPKGMMNVLLKTTNEQFVWEKPYSSVHNIIFGKMYVDHHGEMEIRNAATGDICRINMKKRGWFDSDPNQVDGTVYDASGVARLTLSGKWSQSLTIKALDTGEETLGWELRPFQEGFEYNYYFTDFTIQLNIPPEMFPTPIVRTDSRYRPDQRALENGDLQTAVSEKLRVEDKQRTKRRQMESSGEHWTPMWFKQDGSDWVYQGGYWEDKASLEFRAVPDIF